MRPNVYIESSVISYLTSRASRALVIAAHQAITQDWWETALPGFDAYISPIVLAEIARGDPQAAAARLEAVSEFAVLAVTPNMEQLADMYFEAI